MNSLAELLLVTADMLYESGRAAKFVFQS